jgi:hypothetical protein
LQLPTLNDFQKRRKLYVYFAVFDTADKLLLHSYFVDQLDLGKAVTLAVLLEGFASLAFSRNPSGLAACASKICGGKGCLAKISLARAICSGNRTGTTCVPSSGVSVMFKWLFVIAMVFKICVLPKMLPNSFLFQKIANPPQQYGLKMNRRVFIS